MHRSFPILGVILLIVCAGCLGGIGFSDSSDDTTTTTTGPQPHTEAPATTTAPMTTNTASTTTTTQPTSTTTTPATKRTTVEPTTTRVPTQTTAQIDAPESSQRFEARVTKVIDPTTVAIKLNGKNQTIDLLGVSVPESGVYHKRSLQTTKAQLEYSVVTVATDPQVERDGDGHPQMYVYTGEWLYNTQLLRSGYARVADGEFSKRAEFERKQQEAKQGGYGIWNTTTTTT